MTNDATGRKRKWEIPIPECLTDKEGLVAQCCIAERLEAIHDRLAEFGDRLLSRGAPGFVDAPAAPGLTEEDAEALVYASGLLGKYHPQTSDALREIAMRLSGAAPGGSDG